MTVKSMCLISILRFVKNFPNEKIKIHIQKYNLLFFGIAEEADEDPEALVRQVLQGKMEIDLKDKDIEFAEVN